MAGSYDVFDSRFGIYMKCYVYRDVSGIIIVVYGELGTKILFLDEIRFLLFANSMQRSWKWSKVQPII